MRFYLDEDISHQVAVIARARGLDVISSHEVGRDKLTDEEQLRLAAEDGRCFVTRNRDDFYDLTKRFLDGQWPHAGVLIIPPSLKNDRFTAIAEALVTYAESHEFGIAPYTIDFLARVRR